MCSHAQTLLSFRIKESLSIYYLRSLCLCDFVLLADAICLCSKASAERHPVDFGRASVLRRGAFAPTSCLLFSTGWLVILTTDPRFGPTFGP